MDNTQDSEQKNKVSMNEILSQNFLIVDDAPTLSRDVKELLDQWCRINDVEFEYLKFEYVAAGSEEVFAKINEYKNIFVCTTFTTIKSHYFEEIIDKAIELKVSDKNVFSIMGFDVVGSSFLDYKPEIEILAKSNIFFYFPVDNYSQLEKYKTL